MSHAWALHRDEETQAVDACLRAHKADYERWAEHKDRQSLLGARGVLIAFKVYVPTMPHAPQPPSGPFGCTAVTDAAR